MPHEHFTRITIVSVSGLPDTSGAAHALTISLRNMPGARAVLCCPFAPPNLHPAIRHVPIAEMNYSEYSWFVMFALWRVIDTDYALIVQDDGWVLDGSNWRDEYFDYDYIGALSERARRYAGRYALDEGFRVVRIPEPARSCRHAGTERRLFAAQPAHVERADRSSGNQGRDSATRPDAISSPPNGVVQRRAR